MTEARFAHELAVRNYMKVQLKHLLIDAYEMGEGRRSFEGKPSFALRMMAEDFLKEMDNLPAFPESHNATPQQHQTATSAEKHNETDS